MAKEYPTEEWFEAWREAVNNNEEYAQKASDWGVDFNGDYVFGIESDDRLPEDKYFYIGLEGGKCTGVEEIEDPSQVDVGFVYRGNYSDFVKLNEGDLDPIEAMMSGIFSIDGDMQKILQYSDSANVISEIGREIDTEYKY
jgi:putative sterol carrier protein